MLRELEAAHELLALALVALPGNALHAFCAAAEQRGVSGEGVTRRHERQAVIKRAQAVVFAAGLAPTPDPAPLCIDCKYCHTGDPGKRRCAHPNVSRDPVHGLPTVDCRSARNLLTWTPGVAVSAEACACGPAGRLFVAADAVQATAFDRS